MVTTMVYTIFLGILIGILMERFLFPYLDLFFEVATHKFSSIATSHQLDAQTMICEFGRDYPESQEKPELSPAIGFSMGEAESSLEFDEEDCEDKKSKIIKNKNEIGFRY